MEIQFFNTPEPHFIIDDFLPKHAANDVLLEAIELEPEYQDAKIQAHDDSAKHIETCEECKLNSQIIKNNVRDNKVVYLDSVFKNAYNKSRTISYLTSTINNPEFISGVIEHNSNLFRVVNIINTSETIISRFGKCDFYGWHIDALPKRPENRLVTISYYINKEPNEFKGGSLILLNTKTNEKKKINPKHNRAVIFLGSSAIHSVESVDLKGKKWEDGRFSVQFWLGFNSFYNFRGR